jgi:asparagine synthase (glutamine-hydrolysing)
MNQCNPRASDFSSGLYGLFRLDGGPLENSDARYLGFSAKDEVLAALAEGRDRQTPGAIHCLVNDAEIAIVVGDVFEIDALTSELGISRKTAVAALAKAALMRFGSELPAHMLGEWSMLYWQRANRRLTLMSSAARRDRIHYTAQGAHVAVAADPHCLARLPWVGNDIDEAGVIARVGIAPIRTSIGDATIYRNIRQLLPGHCVTIDLSGVRTSLSEGILPAPQRWNGSLEEAVVEADSLMRRIMQDRLEHTRKPITLLSGGLDSALQASYAADEGNSVFMASVAPPDSGIADERHFAQIAAEHLGGELIPVFPLPEANIYRPPDHIFRATGGPAMSNRHCLTEAFQQAARRHGGTMLVNGTYGEMSLTARLAKPGIRQLLGRLARSIRPAPATLKNNDLFHVRLAPHRLANFDHVPEHFIETPYESGATLAGYLPGVEKALAHTNEFYAGALRMDFPYRDLRLLRFFAGLPLDLLRNGAEDRLLARELLKDRLPDSIRLRRSGMPASPDHMARLQRQAPLARARIAVFQQQQIDDWLDLDWLDGALEKMAEKGPADVKNANEVQLTAMTAEWLCWWQANR